MNKTQKVAAMLLVITSLFFFAQIAMAQKEQKHEMAGGASKVADGIKATFKFTPANSMIDLFLADSGTGKAITKAKVMAVAKGPDGKTQEKELMGMQMGKDYTFGNTFDFSKKGNYGFAIAVEVDKKKVKFDFTNEVK